MTRRRRITVTFTPREQAELRRLVYRAWALRGKPGYREALEAIESWHAEVMPEALRRLEEGRAA